MYFQKERYGLGVEAPSSKALVVICCHTLQ